MSKIKTLLAISILAVSASASAQHHHHGGYRHGGGGWGWVAPAVIGGTVVYAMTRPPVVVQQQPPVVIQQQPMGGHVWQQQTCTPWTETMMADGSITRTRICQ
jgi:hypothetical protein